MWPGHPRHHSDEHRRDATDAADSDSATHVRGKREVDFVELTAPRADLASELGVALGLFECTRDEICECRHVGDGHADAGNLRRAKANTDARPGGVGEWQADR